MEGALRPGNVLLGKYRIESVLGRGGMGVVLRVTHLQLGEELAIKVLLPEGATSPETSPEMTSRFLREARSMVRLRGEHVAKVTDVGVLPEGLPFMVMEYLRGVDLADELKRRKQLAPGEAVDYLLQVCEALAEAHAHGIVHRDIKPANLFLTTRPDGTPLVKVLDFGISKAAVVSSVVTKTDIVMGTAAYMSPEQLKAAKDVDGRADIWALGIVLYECLSGRRPFLGDTFSAVVLKAGTEPPPSMDAGIPRGLQSIVLRCLEKNREARYPSIAELATALGPFARDQRAAATIVDRASLIRQRPGSTQDLPPLDHSLSEPAVEGPAVEGEAGSPPPRSRRNRYIGAGVLALLGSIAVVSVVALARSGGGRGTGEQVGGQAGSGGAGRSEHATVPDAELRSATAPAPDALPTTVAPTGDGKPTPLMVCADLEEQKRWHDLLQCTVTLEVRGFKVEAKAFRDKASEETLNEVIDGNARQALRAGDLRTAQALLKQMTADSVYLASLRDAFDKIDARNVEDAKRKVNESASSHDCVGARRYFGELSIGAAGTDRAIAAVKEVVARCADKPPAR